MDSLASAHAQLEKKANLSKAVADVQALIDHLQSTRDNIEKTPEKTALHMAKLKQPVKQSFDRIEEDLKEVNKGLNQYQKALREKFKGAQLPVAGEVKEGAGPGSGGVLGRETGLVNRAVAMHLLREGQFGVANTLVKEANRRMAEGRTGEGESIEGIRTWTQDFGSDPDAMDEDNTTPFSAPPQHHTLNYDLRAKFSELHHILYSLTEHHDPAPAIFWTQTHATELANRGSNLAFQLARLKFSHLYTASTASDPYTGPLLALQYARETFPEFGDRYSKEAAHLIGSLAYCPDISASPYQSLFCSPKEAYESAADTFSREFTSLLGLSPTSPLYIAVTSGAISLPVLQKVERLLSTSKSQWTSPNELPVETPLPVSMRFHSVFVCPVSKEQATDLNPPIALPCGHVIARESLEQHARGKGRVKCPYCPSECSPREGRRVYI